MPRTTGVPVYLAPWAACPLGGKAASGLGSLPPPSPRPPQKTYQNLMQKDFIFLKEKSL